MCDVPDDDTVGMDFNDGSSCKRASAEAASLRRVTSDSASAEGLISIGGEERESRPPSISERIAASNRMFVP